MTSSRLRVAVALMSVSALLLAQQAQPPATPPAQAPGQAPAGQAQQPAQTPAQPAGQAPGQPAQGQSPVQVTPPAQPPATTTPATAPAQPAAGALGGLNFFNVSLTEVIDILAQKLKINYILDPKVNGKVTINTYGEIKPIEVRQLLETILRMNGAVMVQVGDLYRIVPAADAVHLPISPRISGSEIPNTEEMILNMIFLKYASVTDMKALLDPFMGEGRTIVTYDPANLLIILDNARSMRRTMELISLFDNDSFATKRVRLFELENGSPSEMAKELETVFKAFSLSEKNASVRFMPLDRISTIIAVAPNPGIFDEVAKWIAKLDVPVKITAGSVNNYVYRLKYGCAETVAGAVMQLYGLTSGYGGGYGYGGGFGGGNYANQSGCGGALGAGPGGGVYGGGTYGQGGYGGGGGGYGYPGGAYGGFNGYGASGYSPNAYPQQTYQGPVVAPRVTQTPFGPAATGAGAGTGGATTPSGTAGGDLTGSYLTPGAQTTSTHVPRIIPNPFDNSILVQASPQEWEQIKKLLEQIDIPPRQVLIEAKIYEVDLTGAFSSGVSAAFQAATSGQGKSQAFFPSLGATALAPVLGTGGISLTASALVGKHRELLAFLTANEDNRRTRVLSEPSILATDSIPASINVGTEVPTLASQALAGGVQVGGNSLFTNTISNRNTGVTLSITARVNPSGIVTMVINQEVSAAEAPAASAAIQSPSISKKNVSTQVTVQDGDTIAIGGVIQETNLNSSTGIPGLHRIPVVGGLFGAKSVTKTRSELVVFLTPRVIYDTNQMLDASQELIREMKRVQKLVKDN